MKYTVLVTASAAAELDAAYDWLLPQTPQHGPEWYNSLLDAILSLEQMPGRFPFSPDNDPSDKETRKLIYGDRRHAFSILFEIRGDKVIVTHIRHAARDSLEN